MIVGSVLFILVLLRIDLGELWQAMKELLWIKLILLLAMRLIYWLIRTLNWHLILNRLACPIPFFSLFTVRLASNTVNYLLPSANIGGEWLRMTAFPERDRVKLIASVVIEKSCECLVTFFLVFLSVLLVVLPESLTQSRKVLILGGALLLLIASGWLIHAQRHGLFGALARGLQRLPIFRNWIGSHVEKLTETDRLIGDFYSRQSRFFQLVLILLAAQLLVWAAELYLIFWFTGARAISFSACLLILNLGALIVLLPTTPGALGLFEFSNISLFTLLRVPMHFGIASILVRRVLGYAFAGIGLIPLARMHWFSRKRKSKAEGLNEALSDDNDGVTQ